MILDDLTTMTGEWLRGVGPMSDIVISSRVRLARNLADSPFLSSASTSDRTEIYRVLADAICSTTSDENAMLVDIDKIDEIDRQFLVERHLISRQHAAGEGSRGVSVSSSESRALMINEEDHLRIQCLRSGLQLDELWQEVNGVDDVLSADLAFAFDPQFGFLTACPTNVGTGIRVSVMLHLPALKLTKEMDRVDQAAKDMRLAVRGVHGEGTETVGDLYQVSNQTTLGKTEEDIIRSFGKTVIPRIVEYERAARASLEQHRTAQLDDMIWRAYGVLRNARCIGSEETQSLLSPIRMGIHLGRFKEFDLETLIDLFLKTQPAHLQKILGKPLDGEQRAVARADYIRQRLA